MASRYDKRVFLAGIIVFFISLTGALVFGENIEIEAEVEGGVVDLSDYVESQSQPEIHEEYAREGAPTDITYSVPDQNVFNVSFKLTWEDEDDADLRHTNQPDKFTIEVSNNDGSITRDETHSNPEGGRGVIEFTVRLFDEDDPPAEFPFMNGTGGWNITVSVEAGDHEPLVPDPFGLRTLGDDGNAFSLEINHEYYEPRD